MAGEVIPVEVDYGALEVSVSAREARRAWLTDQIIEVHQASYGARRAHAEPTLGRMADWSIDFLANAALATDALGVAVDARRPSPGTTIRLDQGAWFVCWVFTRRVRNPS